MIFSQRYKDLIEVGNGESKDHICGEIEFEVKQKIAKILENFREPQKYHPSRYDSWEETTDALEIAAKKVERDYRSSGCKLGSDGFQPHCGCWCCHWLYVYAVLVRFN
jgi:hypothetical protein